MGKYIRNEDVDWFVNLVDEAIEKTEKKLLDLGVDTKNDAEAAQELQDYVIRSFKTKIGNTVVDEVVEMVLEDIDEERE